MKFNTSGFSLVELLITMSVFIVVIIITGNSFDTLLSQSSKIFKSEESNIEGVVGLEILRHDIQQAGFGLYTEGGINYSEADEAPANELNDAPANAPRPLVCKDTIPTGTANILPGSDYLAIKATSVATNAASQKWTYLSLDPAGVIPKKWPSTAENPENGDNVILLRRQVSSAGNIVNLTQPSSDTEGSSNFSFSFGSNTFAQFSSSGTAAYTIYGLSSGNTVRMPFNRSDYFVARPQTASQLPSFCAPGSGILYKTTVNQADGKLTRIPLLDCVADMQVVLGWDMDSDGTIDTYSNADGSTTSGTGTQEQVQKAISNDNNNSSTTTPSIRNNLKMVKVYILAQQGKRDSGYTSPAAIVVGDARESILTRVYDIAAAGWLNYRWKVYQIIARPKNLPANQ